ncbi:MAG: nucleoside kinase [Synergistaceae bacterium]|jgi:uridine kinase|nr:nucleoside kinase [Synergistaceae bacterium]
MGFYVNVIEGGEVHKIYSDTPIMGHEVLSFTNFEGKGPGLIVAWRVNRILRPMSWVVDDEADVEFVDTSSFEGAEIYRSTLTFLLALACKRALDRDVSVKYSMGDSYYCEFQHGPVTEEQIVRVKEEMEKMVASALPIQLATLPLDKTRRIFERQGNEERARLVQWTGSDPVMLYRCAGIYGYFGVPLASSTGVVKTFDLNYFAPGFLLRFPSITAPAVLPPLQFVPKLMDVFREYANWLNVLGLSTMDSLHERVAKGKSLELILISEAFHGEALARIANSVIERPDVRLLCLAGPSSSGKTTTSKRLAIQLQVSGKKPVTIALDDYYVDRDKTPLGENGDYDFEALEALDIELINEQINALLAGEEVRLPRFDFVTGTRKPGRKLRLTPNDILIIEGIHGLNDKLTADIPGENKCKVFISPLTGVNLDAYNRIGTTDTRLLRRLVRDYRTRGYGPERTLLMWPSVIKGSHKHIFPYEEGANMLFNTSLVYEISVLKGYAEPLLRSVPENSPAYGEASRLLSMLAFAPVIPSDNVPNLSILREFIGGGCFED